MTGETNLAAALALNNIGLSLVRHDCHELAIAAFCDSLSLLRCLHSPESVYQMMDRANQFLACWKDFVSLQEERRDDRHSCLHICRRDMPLESLTTALRNEVEQIILRNSASFNLIFLSFAESPISCAERLPFHCVVFESIILNNLASAFICAWEQQPNELQLADIAVEIWGQNASLLERMLFNGIYDDSLRSQVSSLHVFVLCCIERTATVLGLQAVATEFSNQIMTEYSYFCEIDEEEGAYEIPTDIAAASAA
jgi:hypothetical protein